MMRRCIAKLGLGRSGVDEFPTAGARALVVRTDAHRALLPRGECSVLRLFIVLLLGLALFSGQAHAQVAVSPDEVSQGDPNLANVALVFNVGAGFEPATAILDTLADQQQRVTFFV